MRSAYLGDQEELIRVSARHHPQLGRLSFWENALRQGHKVLRGKAERAGITDLEADGEEQKPEEAD